MLRFVAKCLQTFSVPGNGKRKHCFMCTLIILSQGSLEYAAAEARQMFAMDSQVINFIVGILVLYLVIYFITFYLGPVLFGLRPYHPVWPYFRSAHHVERRSADLKQVAS